MELSDVRLLHVFKSLNIGGLEKSTILYSNHLTKDVAFVGILACKGVYDHGNIVWNEVKLFYPPLNMGFNPLTFVLYFAKISQTIKRYNINVINYHHRVFAPLIWLVKIINHNISTFYTAHNVFDDYRNLLLTADTFVAVSEASKRDLQRSGKKNIVVLTHGIETIQRTRHRQRNRTIGYIGRLERHKGILCLLDAMRILVDKNMGYKLILRGEGPLEKEILRRREDLRIEKQVALDPPRIREDEILDNIDLLVLPSFVLEGFGLVLVEAMREGIPVVGSNIGGINEVITDGFNGRLVEPGNPRQLADTIQEILDDEVKRELLVANGRRTIKDKYSLERYLTNYRQLLTNI